MVPNDLKYSEEHEWVQVESGLATVGITDYAQKELGDIVFVELPSLGEEVSQMEPFGTVEAVKAVSELYSPVSGEVVEVNAKLEDTPQIINSDPYGEGWMVKIKVANEEELENLLSPKEYREFIGE
ncbi:MAG: glycine cleavage system protein H [candidate division Zixibacteria bacterium SM23_81]|nr:MAG: glycine cleavage system protein H [candidate division Zixibacteria bacterium SM23_81]